jgi:hypothetical protein
MIAKINPGKLAGGKRSEVAARYGLTVEEFTSAVMDFLQMEGHCKNCGYECETLHIWLTHNCKEFEDNTPWQKGDDQPF